MEPRHLNWERRGSVLSSLVRLPSLNINWAMSRHRSAEGLRLDEPALGARDLGTHGWRWVSNCSSAITNPSVKYVTSFSPNLPGSARLRQVIVLPICRSG
jgi:hypothetical protein